MSIYGGQPSILDVLGTSPPPLPRALWFFGSHSWDHDHDREGMHRLIGAGWRRHLWRDLSVPRHAPLHINGGSALENAISRRISASEVVLAFAGKYSSYSDWIEFEIETAVWLGKPIVAVVPRGEVQPSTVVMDHHTIEAGWNGKSIREAILDCLPIGLRRAIEPTLRRSEASQEMMNALGLPRMMRRG